MQEEPRAMRIDLDASQITTRVGRYAPSENLIAGKCPTHGDQPFNYNVAMDAYFCDLYHWGPEEGFREDVDCDSVILAADMAGDPDGGHVRHRRTMVEVRDEEYERKRAGDEKYRLTERSEPTAPPGHVPPGIG